MPSRVLEGPEAAVEALAQAMTNVLAITGVPPRAGVARSAWTRPGRPAPTGSSRRKGSTNFSQPAWRGFDFRRRAAGPARPAGRLQQRRQRGRALRALRPLRRRGRDPLRRSPRSSAPGSAAASIEAGQVVTRRGRHGRRARSRAHPDATGCSSEGQPIPTCDCGFLGDVESVASLTGIERNLLPYWLTRYPDHPLRQAESIRRRRPSWSARTASRATRWP